LRPADATVGAGERGRDAAPFWAAGGLRRSRWRKRLSAAVEGREEVTSLTTRTARPLVACVTARSPNDQAQRRHGSKARSARAHRARQKVRARARAPALYGSRTRALYGSPPAAAQS